MNIEFETTLEEIVDVLLRAQSQSKVVRGWLRQNMMATALLAGGLMFLIIPDSLAVRLAFALGAFIGGGILYALIHKPIKKRRLRKFIREHLGTDGPVPFQLELTEAGIWTRQKDTQVTFGWSNVASIVDTPESVDMPMRDGGLLVVRNRAFASPEQRREFLELAREHMTKAVANQAL